ncbi:MAG TPA: hypothetical protein VL463_05050 [Kofleriaceae bacterium]|nr:hypothetical protein [Kofleriaceae bacterium]
MRAAIWIAIICASTTVARADDARDWLDGLYDLWAPRVERGEPIVVTAHVPLCDNRIIRCGNKRLGDGDNPDTNLYWNTDEGFLGWFDRKGSGWKREKIQDAGAPSDVLETRVWHRTFKPKEAWNDRKVGKPIEIYVIAYAWRGTSIDQTLAAYLDDVYGDQQRTVVLDDGTRLAAGGKSAIVAWVGHNRLMDVDPIDWAARAKSSTSEPKGVIAEACETAPYMAAEVSSETRVPLLMTNDFLFAGANAFEGVVTTFARGGSLKAMRDLATVQYAQGQGETVHHVGRVFTNPAESRWPGPGKITRSRGRDTRRNRRAGPRRTRRRSDARPRSSGAGSRS